MKDKLDKFFYSQIKEHELVISKTKESIKENFLNVVDICYQALKNKKKIIFFLLEIKNSFIFSFRVLLLITFISSSIPKSFYEGHIVICLHFYNTLAHFWYLFYKVLGLF